MNYLSDFIKDQNRLREIFKEPKLFISTLSQDNIEELARSIDCKLSPENLHCDGEISRSEAQEKYNYLSRVVMDLERFCAVNNFDMPRIHEL